MKSNKTFGLSAMYGSPARSRDKVGFTLDHNAYDAFLVLNRRHRNKKYTFTIEMDVEDATIIRDRLTQFIEFVKLTKAK